MAYGFIRVRGVADCSGTNGAHEVEAGDIQQGRNNLGARLFQRLSDEFVRKKLEVVNILRIGLDNITTATGFTDFIPEINPSMVSSWVMPARLYLVYFTSASVFSTEHQVFHEL
ncbi:hypothetical protein N7510_010685 [Penicillium lagena]|uniref:uncharacterized protein n=1 Tax=Penicillium lagena TaxID=94218 RepID=UPI002541E4FD|nr:uncharacterized protein N7510_010685 [Penicillium lagena]KAJ5601151.1 hypothetical protein N7510_010685 [Penicillium lagena]